jgi:hypothetical protein
MADSEGRDPEGGNRSKQPGGSLSQGANPDPGGEVEPGGLVPPYEGRTTGGDGPASEERAESVARQLSETKTGQPGATASPADERPVRDDEVTDQAPTSPMGVGTSPTRSGEDVADDGKEPGRQDAGTKDESQRPVGVSDERDSTGVDPQD